MAAEFQHIFRDHRFTTPWAKPDVETVAKELASYWPAHGYLMLMKLVFSRVMETKRWLDDNIATGATG